MSYELDQIDRKILNELRKDAGQSLEDISKKVGITKTPCWRRVQKLEEAGTIVKRTIVVDSDKLGLNCIGYVRTKGLKNKILDVLRQEPYIMEIERLTGEYSIMLKVAFESTKDFGDFCDILEPDVLALDSFIVTAQIESAGLNLELC